LSKKIYEGGERLSLNHVNLDKLNKLVEAIKEDPVNAKITPKVSGTWIFEDGQPQFSSDIIVEGGKFTVEADMPSKLGGWGSRPGPLHYCLYGLASCYAFTFSAFAAMKGIILNKLSVEAEGHVDFSQVFGLTENPIVEEVKFKVSVESDADSAKLEELRSIVDQRCPGLYCLTKKINVTTKLVKI
jgi:uncharacterized OsmC-like protein